MLKKFFSRYKSRINLFLLAIMLWLFVVTGREYEIIVDVPITADNIRPGKVLLSDLPQKASVRFRGIGRSLIYLKIFGNARVSLDVSSIKYYYDFELTPESVKYPSSLHITPMAVLSPDTVFVRIDERAERSIPVIPAVEINPKPGYAILGKIKVTPSHILAAGPLTLVKDLESVTTEDIILNDVKSSVDKEAKIERIDPQIRISVKKVNISAEIERLTDLEVKKIPVVIRNEPPGYSIKISPQELTVKIRGPLSAVKKASPENIKAVVTLPDEWVDRRNAFVPVITIPESTELIDFNPDSVYITLSR